MVFYTIRPSLNLICFILTVVAKAKGIHLWRRLSQLTGIPRKGMPTWHHVALHCLGPKNIKEISNTFPSDRKSWIQLQCCKGLFNERNPWNTSLTVNECLSNMEGNQVDSIYGVGVWFCQTEFLRSLVILVTCFLLRLIKYCDENSFAHIRYCVHSMRYAG